MVSIQENVSLKPYNTFGIDVRAKYFCEVKSTEDFVALLQTDIFKKGARMILAGEVTCSSQKILMD